MKKVIAAAGLMLSLALGSVGLAQSFSVFPTLESPDFPNLETELVIEGAVGSSFEFTGNMVVSSTGIEGTEGPQGWSFGVSNVGVDITESTYYGTVSEQADSGGFAVLEILDPTKNGGKQGIVEAIVLHFKKPIYLPPNTDQIVAINKYKATIAASPVTASIKFEEGLVGSGQPVACNVTYKGNTFVPALGEKQIAVRAPGVAETECDDGVDNDGDQKTDCCDTDCAAVAPCAATETGLCADGKDNDCDGQTDAADSDCVVSTEGFDLVMNAPGTTRTGLKNVLNISAPYDGKEISSTAYMAPTGGVAQPEGAQGWSISVNNDSKLEIVEVTTVGTDAMAIYVNGFEATEVVDPASNGGLEGWVSAIVLSFKKPIALDPTKEQSIGLAKYKVEAGTGAADLPLRVRFLDNLKGTGQPVPNVITVKGDTVFATNLVPLEIVEGTVVEQADFKRGDANGDLKVNIADPIWIINELVRQGPATACRDAADANDDGTVDLSDAMYLIQWRFRGQSAPAAPGPFDCGADPTADTLECAAGSTLCP